MIYFFKQLIRDFFPWFFERYYYVVIIYTDDDGILTYGGLTFRGKRLWVSDVIVGVKNKMGKTPTVLDIREITREDFILINKNL